MSMDLRLFAEQKVNGKWEKIVGLKGNDTSFGLVESSAWTTGAFLSNMRNEYGIIPLFTEDDFRGIPGDISKGIFKWFGVVDTTYESLIGETPTIENTWSSWISQLDLIRPSWITFAELLKYPHYDQIINDPYSQSEQKIYDALTKEFTRLFEELKQYGEPENIRLVFWYL